MLTMYQDDKGISQDKSPSPELFEMIQAAASSLTGFAQLWESIRKKGNSEGFSDLQLQWLLRPLLKDKLGMSKDKIYYLFHKEEKAEQNKEAYEKRGGLIRQNDTKKELEESYNPEEEIKKIGEIRRAEQKREAEEPIIPDDEDPKDLEIQFLKEQNEELKEALHKTKQFKPATQLSQETFPPLQEDEVFDWLGKRDDKIKCFYFGSAATGFIKANILKNLENSGIKVFKRLYFEV